MDTANITGSTCLTLYRSKDLSYRLFIKVKVLIFVLNYTLLHLQALELEQSLPSSFPWITGTSVSHHATLPFLR